MILYFYRLGYDSFAIASLFIFYEFFGVVTNLVGGWLGAKLGLNRVMNLGLALQIVALGMLAAPISWLTVPWVMVAQALSGIAKDLNKMSAKSAIKGLVKQEHSSKLFQWVALLTGSKNALKGVGFFLGGLLLSLMGFRWAMIIMGGGLLMVVGVNLICLDGGLGKVKDKTKFNEIFSKSSSVNILSAARLFLFASRDVWFVIALPVYLATVLGWDFYWVGGGMALWVIGYGLIQGVAPSITQKVHQGMPGGREAVIWALLLTFVTGLIALGLHYDRYPLLIIIIGLLVFGTVFAVNSSLHSYLIVHYSKAEGVSLDIGFYYMANAMGRLVGTILSGWVFQRYGLSACMWVSFLFLVLTCLISLKLPQRHTVSIYD